MRTCLMIVGCGVLAGCGAVPVGKALPDRVMASDIDPNVIRPKARPSAGGAVPRVGGAVGGAQTAEALDSTTVAQRAEAASQTGGKLLGNTVASLGDVARPGFWIETPLVARRSTGRVAYPQTGQSAQVDLIPIDGPRTGGSRLSLAAMRLIGAPLTALPEVVVYGP